MHKLTSGIVAAALVVALPMTANAQDAAAPEAETQEVCQATIAPIQASSHVAATATFASPFGKVAEIDVPAESGIVLVTEAQHEDIVEMADEADGEYEEKAEEMVDEAEDKVEDTENTSLFWLNAENATAGTYDIVLKNESGATCATQITVEG